MVTRLERLRWMLERDYATCAVLENEDIRALLAAVDALREVLALDDGDVPAFWGDHEKEVMDAGRSALSALHEEAK